MSAKRFCTSCGHELGPDDRFCGGCGTKLEAPPQSSTPAESDAVAAPGGARVARASLQSMFQHLRHGEQRPATILMTDVSGFTSLGEAIEPEALFNLINQIFEELVDCLVAHGAHIDKYVGDEIVALFGVPVAQERSAERAILAALAMRERLRSLNEEGRFGGTKLDVHTGINVGPVMVGPVGHSAHADYTVIGDAVNVAKRLSDEAPSGEIYVSQAVAESVGEAFEYESVGEMKLSGRRGSVEVLRVVRARQASRPHLVYADDDETPLSLRQLELGRLAQYADTARAGTRQLVCVTGTPGIGKSRLIAEWCRSDSATDYRLLSTVCHAFGEHFPLLPIADLIAQIAGLHFEGWPPRIAGDLAAAVEVLAVDDGARSDLRAALGSFQGEAKEDGQDWREGLGLSFAELLRAALADGPLCLIVEDVQWVDEASHEVLADTLARITDGQLLVILSSRDPVTWADAMLPGVVPLQPLSHETMSRLVTAWAAPTVLPASTVRAICNRAAGHPYFARELLSSLREMPEGAVGGLPSSLQELFLAQLDQLAPALRRAVQAAAVVGEPLSRSLLEAAMGDEAAAADALLSEARRHGLLVAGSARGQYVFGRRLLFETAYATIPPSQVQGLHARIADHLIAEMGTAGDAAIHAAAHHAFLGYRDERAVDLLIRSARLFRAQYANRQAIQTGSRAVELIASHPVPATLLEQRLEALMLLAQSYQVIGDLGMAEGSLAEAEVIAEDCSNQELIAKIATSAATLSWMQGNSDDAYQRFARAREAWEVLGNPSRMAQAQIGMGLCAERHSEQRHLALDLFIQAGDTPGAEAWVRGAALNNAGMMLLEDGRYTEAERSLVAGLEANEEDGDRRGVAQTNCSLGELLYRQARFDEARRRLQRIIADATDMEDKQLLALGSAHLARINGITGVPCSDEAVIIPDDYPEAADLWRLAQSEAAIGTCESVAALGVPLEPPDTRGGHSATCMNTWIEALCVAVEAAILTGDPGAEPYVRLLTEKLDHAPDRHLRRYGKWLLAANSASPPAPLPAGEGSTSAAAPPLPKADDGEATVFDVRAERLLAALAQSSRRS